MRVGVVSRVRTWAQSLGACQVARRVVRFGTSRGGLKPAKVAPRALGRAWGLGALKTRFVVFPRRAPVNFPLSRPWETFGGEDSAFTGGRLGTLLRRASPRQNESGGHFQ